MNPNYAVVSVRPAGGAWSSVNDLTRYVQMELAEGALPGGGRLLSKEALLERRVPQVSLGEERTYGMGLMVDSHWGTPLVHHGGDVFGFHSDMFWLPDAGVGGVILTNGDSGVLLRGPFVRRVLEVLFDGEAEAEEDVTAAVKRYREALATDRKRLVVPADPAVAAKLAARYQSDGLGELTVIKKGANVSVDVGEWRSQVATRKNDDGTLSLITIDPATMGFELVVGERDGKRTLTTRDAQHEYVFVERP